MYRFNVGWCAVVGLMSVLNDGALMDSNKDFQVITSQSELDRY
jgi:hypothetical protein